MCVRISYKPQKISPKFQGTVRQLLHKKIRDTYVHPQASGGTACIGFHLLIIPLYPLSPLVSVLQFMSDVMRPMTMDAIIDNGVQELSGGELQRVAITLCLGTPADIYLVSSTLTTRVTCLSIRIKQHLF